VAGLPRVVGNVGGGGRANVSKGKRCGPSERIRVRRDGQVRILSPEQAGGPMNMASLYSHTRGNNAAEAIGPLGLWKVLRKLASCGARYL
jgi:hypothetical protein